MKIKFIILFLLFAVQQGFSQDSGVAIGATTIEPEIIFKVTSTLDNPGGVLFPEIALSLRSLIAPFTVTPTNGLIVYNTHISNLSDPDKDIIPGYYFWDNPNNSWTPFSPTTHANQIFKASNQRTNVNFNDGTHYMDIFANVSINQASSLYQKQDDISLRITETGYYRITLNLDMWIKQKSQDRDVFGIALYLNGIKQTDEIVVPTKEIHGGTQTVGASHTLHLNVPLGGGNLQVRGSRIHGAADIFFNNPTTSTIAIQKIR